MSFKKKHIFTFSAITILTFIVYQFILFYYIPLDNRKDNKDDIIGNDQLHLRTHEDRNINSRGIIRGIHIKSVQNYRPDSSYMFSCLTGDQKIPFDYVNDDYCDCEDESDEPSTSACIKGVFYCDTQLTNKLGNMNILPSSRVNDGICDCCDGSDEWISSYVLVQKSFKTHIRYAKHCPNVCNQSP